MTRITRRIHRVLGLVVLIRAESGREHLDPKTLRARELPDGIDALYRVHYLQWTGIKLLDRILGVVGLATLVVLAFFGLRLAFARRAT